MHGKKHIKKIGNNLEIHAGIPGPASLQTLISYAKSCGIGNSLQFLSKQAFNIIKLASTKTPDKLIYDLACYKNSTKHSALKKLHFYPFGGIKITSDWLNLLKKSEFTYNINNEFEILTKLINNFDYFFCFFISSDKITTYKLFYFKYKN